MTPETLLNCMELKKILSLPFSKLADWKFFFSEEETRTNCRISCDWRSSLYVVRTRKSSFPSHIWLYFAKAFATLANIDNFNAKSDWRSSSIPWQTWKNYQLEDIHNCAETAISAIAAGLPSGIKKSKQRIIILLTVNVTGSHKSKPLIINSSTLAKTYR